MKRTQWLVLNAALALTCASPLLANGATAPAESGLLAVLEIVEKGMLIVAYAVAGAWVYFNYFKGRTYEARLEVKVSGEVLPTGAAKLAKITSQIKNVGLSKVELHETGSAIRVEGYDHQNEAWVRIGTHSVSIRRAPLDRARRDARRSVACTIGRSPVCCLPGPDAHQLR